MLQKQTVNIIKLNFIIFKANLIVLQLLRSSTVWAPAPGLRSSVQHQWKSTLSTSRWADRHHPRGRLTNLTCLPNCAAFSEWSQGQKMCSAAQSCPTLRNPMYCSPPGSSVHGISQTGVGSHFLLQGIFLTQGSNLRLLPCLLWSHLGSPGPKNRTRTNAIQ